MADINQTISITGRMDGEQSEQKVDIFRLDPENHDQTIDC